MCNVRRLKVESVYKNSGRQVQTNLCIDGQGGGQELKIISGDTVILKFQSYWEQIWEESLEEKL